MGLFWSGNELAALRREQSKLWLEDLSEFSSSTVKDACREWRRNHTKRPAIADIRQLCVRLARPALQAGAPPALMPPAPKRKLPDDLIRENWRTLPIREWTKFELQTSNMEMLSIARRHGFNTGDDRQDRCDYNRAVLAGRFPSYDATTGAEGRICDNAPIGAIPSAPEYPADSVRAASDAVDVL